jgi:hypothetical protein
MKGEIAEYKLAWVENNELKSLFFDSEYKARKEADKLADFYYLMKLKDKKNNYYSWELLPGEYNFYLFHWQKLMIGFFIVFILLYILVVYSIFN